MGVGYLDYLHIINVALLTVLFEYMIVLLREYSLCRIRLVGYPRTGVHCMPSEMAYSSAYNYAQYYAHV